MIKKKVYLISNIEEYGKLISLCIDKDVSVFRVFWDEREKGRRCYHIDWKNKRCYYGSRYYYESEGYEIVLPCFFVDQYGTYRIENKNENKE